MKLLLASSADGYLCRDALDDMKWTGKLDKAIFKLLTLSGEPLLAGTTTFNQMPQLQGRDLIQVSRGTGENTLENLAQQFPNAWVIGGPTLARAALEKGLIDTAYISVVPEMLERGYHAVELYDYLPSQDYATQINIGDVVVWVYKWPAK